MPYISHVAWEQSPRLTPIRRVIVEHNSSGFSAYEGAVTTFHTVPPHRIVIDPIGRVGDHQVRLAAAEHALDVRRDRAVAAEETVPARKRWPPSASASNSCPQCSQAQATVTA